MHALSAKLAYVYLHMKKQMIQKDMKTKLFKSMNLIRRGSGASLNLFRYAAMVIMLLTLGIGNAWGSSTTYYSKVSVSANPTGAGSVYVKAGSSFSGTATSDTQDVEEEKSHTYSIKATPNTGYAFKSWSGFGVTINGTTSASTTCTITASSTDKNNRTSGTATATFVKVFQFKAKADFASGSAGLGKVYVSFTNGTPAYQATDMTVTATQNGTDATTANATKTAYFYAEAPTGTEFRGWYSDAAGETLVSANASYSPSIISSVIAQPSTPLQTLYAKFEKVETTPSWALAGIAGTAKTLQIGETIGLITEANSNPSAWGTPTYVDAGETNPVMTYDPSTKTFTANRAGTVTVTFTQAAGEDANGVLWKAGEQTFTFTVNKLTPQFAWADPLPNFVVGTTLPVSSLFSFTPAESAQNWTLTSSDPTNLPSIAAPATGLSLPKEVNGVTLTFHQDATWKWNEIANTSIKINVTKEPVVFNWKNPSLIAGSTYSWTDFVETNSEGAWNLVSEDESVIPTMRSIASTSATVSAGTVTLTFTQGQDLAHDAVPVQTKTFTVYPADGLATFKVGTTGSTFTDDLAEALSQASKLSSNKYVFVARDGVVLPGTYNIPSGVTLVVPYESTYQTANITQPKEVANSTFPIEAYRTLTLVDGVTINVSGAIAVCAQVQSGDASHNPSGFPVGPVGVIDMSTGGEINVKSGGFLYAWGFIKGEGYLDGNNTTHVGSVTAESGSTIWECFGMGDWNGGSFTYAAGMNSKSYKIFPFQSYYVQNIEVPLHMKYGAEEKLFASCYANSNTNNLTITFISYGNKTALFLVTENSATSEVVKRYDPTTDHMVVDLVGNSKLGALEISILVTVSSKDYDLPLVNNMHIRLIDCNLSLTSPVKMFPGSVFEVTKGSKLTVSTNVYVIDHDDWGKVVNKHYFGVTPKILTPHVNLGDNIDENTLADAKIIVDGDVVISSGGIFTSAAGANVMGNGGGTFKWSGNLPSNATTYGYTLGNSVDGSTFWAKLKPAGILTTVCNPAKLHNDAETENDSYTASVGSKTFYNIHGRWFVQEDKDEKTDHTYNFKYLNNGNTATTPAVYSSDKTGLKGGYKWVNVSLDNNFCGNKTYLGIDGHNYYYNSASKDAVSKWVQLVKLNDALYSGSDNNLYTFTANNCSWASVGEIDENCMYTVEGVKKALVGTEFVALEKDEYDEVYVKVTDHSDYYMLFSGCVWQHATKIPDTYRAYEVLGNPYIWLNNEWTEVAEESPYYYTTDDQNIKHYYEFDNVTFSWRPVTNKVRITTDTERRDFLNWDMAMLYLSQYTNPTVTLLDDAIATQSVATLAPGSKSTQFTFDLNGHTLTANIGSAAYFMNMNTTATLYITDTSDKENGQMLIYGAGNKKMYGLQVTKGNVVMNGGRIYMENGAVYASNTSCQTWAIYLLAGQSLTINGGEIEAKGHRNAVGVYAASSAATATTSKITMNGGKVTATAPNYAYGILSYGIINMNGGVVEAKTEKVTTAVGTTNAGSNAYGLYGNITASATDASSYFATINMTGGTVNATAHTATAYGVFGSSTYTTANGKKSDGTSDNSYKSTDGTYSNKASCKLNITGGEVNAVAKTSTGAYGIYSAGTYNSYKDYNTSTKKITITPHVIKDVKVFAQATGTAYGILMSAQAHEYSGGTLWGEAVIDNADVYAETTVSTDARAVSANATNIWTNRARYSQVSASNKKTWYVKANNNDGDVTHEGISATSTQVYQYQIGCHVAAAKITINSGTYCAKSANSTTAYGVYCARSVCPGDPTGNTAGVAEVTINGGTFSAETMTDTGYGIGNYGITTVNGGTFNVRTGTTTAYGVCGFAGTLTLNSGVIINSTADVTTAYGVAANGWIDGNTGMHAHGNVIVNEGVTVNVTTPNSSTAYGAYALATNAELNQTKYNARSESSRKEYYAVNEEGTTTTNGLTANYYPYRFGTYVEGGEITINGGTFNVTTFGSTAIGAGTHYSNLVRTTELGRVKVGRGVLNVHGGTFNVESQTSSTVEGIRSYGLTHVYDGTFNVQTKTTNAYGVCARDGKTTIDGGTFNVTAGTSTAVGVSAWADEYDTNYGFGYAGELEVNGGTFNVKTWNGSEAYGVQVRGTTKNFAAAKVVIGGVADTKKDYAIAGTATINGGTFIMTPSNGTKAYSTHVYTTQTLGTATATPTCYVKGGFFQTNGTTTSGMYVSAFKENNVVTGGHFSDNTGLTSTTATKNYVNDPYHVLNCVHPEYKATYPYEVAEAYTITFKDDAGNTLWSGLQPKGSTAVYPLTNGIPEKAATATNSFEFASWDKALAEVTEDATYTASFNTVAKKFMVTWKDDEGNEIDHMEYASGSTPAHADPVKEGYNFTGWTPAITVVGAADQVYTASFTIKQYTIRFVDENGTELKVQTVNHGVKPTAPANPTKDGYSFSAWNPGIVAATEPVTYTATYLLNIASVTTSAGKTTPYTSWSGALGAANGAANSTLTLLTDVGGLGSAQAITQTFILDLNGHTLSGTANKLLDLQTAGKTLTIRDSQGGGKIATKYATKGQLVAVYVTKGTLNIEGGHILAENTNTSETTSYYACGVLVSSGYTCNMSGGTVEGITNIDLAYGLYNNGGTVTITGGTIKAQAQTKAHAVHVKGNTTVTDEHEVVINATTTRTTIADAFYVTAAGKTLTINGGVFTATTGTTDGYAINATAAATINVNGGKFKSTTKTVSNTGSATIHLNAGFYDTDTELAGFASPKQVVALTTEPEKAEGYNYKIVDNAHQVTFKNEDGSIVLQQSYIEDGIQPVYSGEAQTKAPTPKYAYDFDGWKDASDDHVYAEAELPVVSEDVVYTAHFVQRAVEYPITFANIDGMGTDYVQMVAYDEVPVYNGPTPYMSGAVSNYAYTFIGWDPEPVAVAGPATYTPRYDLVISHNVSFVINNASATTPAALTVAEGAAVERPADQLIGCQHIAGWYKDADLNEEWDFASDKMGDHDIILYAKWETKTYTITWLDENADEIDQTTVDCGTVPTHADLYKPSTAACSYEWRGWNKTLVAANADATYKSLGFTQVPKRYAITFVTGAGATAINPIEQEVGSAVVAPANPTREGYTFNGWNPAVPSVMPANDMECVAQWTVNTHKLAWNFDGGTPSGNYTEANNALAYGTAITYPTLSKTGYTFAGWSTNATSMPDADLTITASWTVNTHKLAWNFDGGTPSGNYTETNNALAYGSAITYPTLSKTGYTFAGWSSDATSMPDADLTITASWTVNTHKLAWNFDGGTPSGNYTETNNALAYGSAITYPTLSKTGYTFAGWSSDATSMPDADLTITASWTPNTNTAYTVEHYWQNIDNDDYTKHETEGKTGTTDAATAAVAKSYTGFTAKPFAQGTIAGDGSTVVKIYYDRITYTITWKDGDGNTIETDANVKYGATPAYIGETPTKTATAQYTYTFDGWSETEGGDKLASLPVVSEDATYFAHYASTVNNYTVSIAATPAGYGTVSAASVAEVPYGSDVTVNGNTITVNGTAITATPAENTAEYTYTFDHWENVPATVMGNVDNIQAVFTRTLRSYTVRWENYNGDELETDLNVAYGATPTYNGATPAHEVDPEYNHTFDGWTPEISPVTGDVTYTAKYTSTKKKYTITWKDMALTTVDHVIKTDTLEWHNTPSFYYQKESDERYSYVFLGWSPEVTLVEGNATYVAQYNAVPLNMIVEDDETIPGNVEVVTTTVKVSGHLTINEGAQLTTNDLILEASGTGSGDINGADRVQLRDGGKAYFDYTFDVDPWHWSAFGVPFEIDLKAAAPLKETTTPMVLGSDYDIVYYDSDERAAHGPSSKCWKYVEYDAERKLTPGKLYMIAFNRPVGHVDVVRFTKAAEAAIDFTANVALTTTGTGDDNNWNGIANPRMYHALLDAGVTECQVHDGGEIGKDGYYTYDMQDRKFFVGKAAFVQVPNEQLVMTTTQATDQGAIVKKAPRRNRAEINASRYDVQIAPMAEEMSDRVFLLTDEDKADEYVIVSDLAKAGVSPVRPQMWVNRYGVKLCKNTVAMRENIADYPLGISVPADGSYDIFLEERPNNDDMLYLTYDGEAIWNLSYGACTIDLPRGTNDHYGLRVVAKSPQVATGIEEATIQNGDAVRKVIVEDKVYIIRNGQIFGIDGRLAK